MQHLPDVVDRCLTPRPEEYCVHIFRQSRVISCLHIKAVNFSSEQHQHWIVLRYVCARVFSRDSTDTGDCWRPVFRCELLLSAEHFWFPTHTPCNQQYRGQWKTRVGSMTVVDASYRVCVREREKLCPLDCTGAEKPEWKTCNSTRTWTCDFSCQGCRLPTQPPASKNIPPRSNVTHISHVLPIYIISVTPLEKWKWQVLVDLEIGMGFCHFKLTLIKFMNFTLELCN